MPGVRAVFTADDMPPRIATGQIPMLVPNPAIRTPRTQIPLARNEVCYVGQTIAVVIAISRHVAEDAASAVNIDFEPLPAVSDARDALKARRCAGAQRPRFECRSVRADELRRHRCGFQQCGRMCSRRNWRCIVARR